MTSPNQFSTKQKIGIGCSVALCGMVFVGFLGSLLDPNAGKTAQASHAAAASPIATVTSASPSPTPSPTPTPTPPPAPVPTTATPTPTPSPPPPPKPAPTPTPTPASTPTHTHTAAPAPAQPAPTTAAPANPAGSCAQHTVGKCGWDVGVPPAQAGETATCFDGSVSFSATFSGTCSHHQGVQYWYK